MREQIRKVIDDELQLIKAIPDCDEFEWERTARTAFVYKLESILATEQPAVAHRCNICGGLVQFDGTKPSVSIGPGGKQQ